MSYSEINLLRKSGQLDRALEMAESEYAAVPGKLEAVTLFWCLNDLVKRLEDEDELRAAIDRMRELMVLHDPDNDLLIKSMISAERLLSPEGKREQEGWRALRALQEMPIEEVVERKRLLFKYLQLDLMKPSLLHSRIMEEALKMERADSKEFAFCKFADLWGLDSFRPEDWEQRQTKTGHILPSNVEKAITSYNKALQADPEQEASNAYRQLIIDAIIKYPRNIHLPRYAAQLLARDGLVSEALEAYKRLLMKTSDKFYLWEDLANLVDSPDVEMGMLAGAITSGVYDEFLSNIRLRMADLLCNAQLYANAQTELDRYQRAHQMKGWGLSRKFYNVANRIPRGTVGVDNRPLYQKYKALAEDFLFANVEPTLMVKVWENKEMRNDKSVISWQMRCDQESVWLHPKRFHLDFRSRNGSMFLVKLVDGKAVWAKPATLDEDLPWLRRVTGPVTIRQQAANGKMFGFVEDVFVPGHQLIGLSQGQEVTVSAILNGDKWSSLQLIAQ